MQPTSKAPAPAPPLALTPLAPVGAEPGTPTSKFGVVTTPTRAPAGTDATGTSVPFTPGPVAMTEYFSPRTVAPRTVSWRFGPLQPQPTIMELEPIPEQDSPTALPSSVLVAPAAAPGGSCGSWLLLRARVAELARSRAALAEPAAPRPAQATLAGALQLAHPSLFAAQAPVPRPPGLLLSSTVPARPLSGPQVPPAFLALAQARPCEPRLPLHVSGEAAGVHQGGARAPEGPLPVWYGDLVRQSLRTVPAAKSPPSPHAAVFVVLLEHTFIDTTGVRRVRPTRASGRAILDTSEVPVVQIRRPDPDWWLPPATVPRLHPMLPSEPTIVSGDWALPLMDPIRHQDPDAAGQREL